LFCFIPVWLCRSSEHFLYQYMSIPRKNKELNEMKWDKNERVSKKSSKITTSVIGRMISFIFHIRNFWCNDGVLPHLLLGRFLLLNSPTVLAIVADFMAIMNPLLVNYNIFYVTIINLNRSLQLTMFWVVRTSAEHTILKLSGAYHIFKTKSAVFLCGSVAASDFKFYYISCARALNTFPSIPLLHTMVAVKNKFFKDTWNALLPEIIVWA
jgi:hypothetical protein